VEVGYVADVSGEYAISIFRGEVCIMGIQSGDIHGQICFPTYFTSDGRIIPKKLIIKI
jgi:hypothetical protein